MNGKEASKRVGITYYQLRYFVKRVDYFAQKDATRNHYHDFNFHELVYLKLAAIMRGDGIRLDDISDAIALVDEAVDVAPGHPGTLIYHPDAYKSWFPENTFTNPLTKGKWLWTPLIFRAIEENPNTGKVEDPIIHIPGMIYNVRSVAEEFAQDDQLMLEFDERKEVYEETQVK